MAGIVDPRLLDDPLPGEDLAAYSARQNAQQAAAVPGGPAPPSPSAPSSQLATPVDPAATRQAQIDAGNSALGANIKALATIPEMQGVDPDADGFNVHQTFAPTDPQYNQKAGWFNGGSLTPAAQQARSDLADRKQQAQSLLSERQATQQSLATVQAQPTPATIPGLDALSGSNGNGTAPSTPKTPAPASIPGLDAISSPPGSSTLAPATIPGLPASGGGSNGTASKVGAVAGSDIFSDGFDLSAPAMRPPAAPTDPSAPVMQPMAVSKQMRLNPDGTSTVVSDTSEPLIGQDPPASTPGKPPAGEPQYYGHLRSYQVTHDAQGNQTTVETPPAPPAPATLAGQQPPAKPYTVAQDGTVQFDQANPTASVLAAFKDGAINGQTAETSLSNAKRVEAAHSDVAGFLQDHPQIASAVQGLAGGGAFYAGGKAATLAATASGLNPAIAAGSAELGPFAWVPPAIAAGTEFVGGGLLASWAKNKLENRLGEYSDAVKALQSGAKAYPGTAALAGSLPFLPEAVGSLGGLAGVGNVAVQDLGEGATAAQKIGAATSAVAKAAAPGVVGGAAAESVLRPAISYGADAVLNAAGIQHDPTQAPTLSSIAQAGLLGGLLAGTGLAPEGFNADALGDVLNRGTAHAEANVPMGEPITPEKLSAQFGNNPNVNSQAMSRFGQPLTPAEQELYFKAQARLNQLAQDGKININQPFTGTAKQITRGGQPINSTAIDFQQTDPAQSAAAGTSSTNPPPSPVAQIADNPGNAPTSGRVPVAPAFRADGSPSSAPTTPILPSASAQPAGLAPAGQAQLPIGGTSASPVNGKPAPQVQLATKPGLVSAIVRPGVTPSAPVQAPATQPDLAQTAAQPAPPTPQTNSPAPATPPAQASGLSSSDAVAGNPATALPGATPTTPAPLSPQVQALTAARDGAQALLDAGKVAPEAITHTQAMVDQLSDQIRQQSPTPAAAATSPAATPQPVNPALLQPHDAEMYRQLADAVNTGAASDVAGGKPSVPFQVLSRLKSAGLPITPDVASTIGGQAAALHADPTLDAPAKQTALLQLIRNNLPAGHPALSPATPPAPAARPPDASIPGLPESTPLPLPDREPNTRAGGEAQTTIRRLTTLQQRGITLDELQQRAMAAAHIALARDLNNQVLGSFAAPTTLAGQRSVQTLRQYDEYRSRGNALRPGDYQTIQAAHQTIQDDLTAQRRVIERTNSTLRPQVPAHLPGVSDSEPQLGTEPPISEDVALKQAQRQINNTRPLLERLGIKDAVYGPTQTGSGVEFNENGTLTIDPAKLAKSMTAVRDIQAKNDMAGSPTGWFAQILNHESIHAADAAIAREKGQTLAERYNALPDAAMPDGWQQAGKSAYGAEWDGLKGWQKKAEFSRMVLEGKWTGRISEALYKFLADTVAFLKRVAGFEGTDPAFQDHISEIDARLRAARDPSGEVQTKPVRAARSFKMPYAPTGDADVLDHIVEQGGIRSPAQAKARPDYARLAGDYDSAPKLGGFYHSAVFGGKLMPDQMAEILHQNHGVGDGSTDGMWNAVGKAVDLRRAVAAEQASHVTLEKQATSFNEDAVQQSTAKGQTAINTANLSVGDSITVGDQNLKVIGLDPDTLDLELEDHSKYGVQRVADGETLYVEKVQPAGGNTLGAARPFNDTRTGNLFSNSDQPFNLQGELAPANDRVAAARQQTVPTVDDLAGEKINSRRTAFAPESGTLGIPRAEMPQVASEHRGALANFLQARGIDWRNEDVLPGSLKPTQADFNPGKVQRAADWVGETDRRILVSSDNHVIDGHHQWLARLQNHPNEPMPIVCLNGTASQILRQIHEFPSAGMEKAPDVDATIPGLPEPSTLPRLRSGENQGDLLSSQAEDLKLVGERGTDHGARQQAEAQAQKDADAARAQQEQDQTDLFHPRTVESGPRSMGQLPVLPGLPEPPGAPAEHLDGPIPEEKPETSIADFGEKIGGARKDTAKPLGPRTSAPKPAVADQAAWRRKYVVADELKRDYSTRKDQPTGRFSVMRTDGVRVRAPSFTTEIEAESSIPLIEATRNHGISYSKGAGDVPDWHIYRQMGDRKRPIVRAGFSSQDAAKTYLATHPQEIIEHKFSFPERPWLDRLERTGGTPRTGDVTPKMFQEAFGFRGGEFGNWNKGGDGQMALNHAYDALHDLAETLGVSPKALSLNGELAIAFGARGTGGEGAGAAHYEPGYQVINLTKIKGAGSLAHEWFHAFDHYLGRQDGKATDRTQADDARLASGRDANYTRGEYVSHGFSRTSGVRDELRNAFKAVTDATVAKPSEITVPVDKLAAMQDQQGKYLQQTLDELKRQFTTYHTYSRSKVAATVAQQAEFDRLAGQIVKGEVGEALKVLPKTANRATLWRNSYQPIEDLNALYKSVLGRSFATNDDGSLGKKLFYQIGAMKDAQQRVANAGSGPETLTRNTATDFLRNSRAIDQQRASDYWSTAHEMGARSFESYAADKLDASNRRNDYLVHGADNKLYAMLGLKPYPEGDERATLNRAWQHVWDTIDEKPTSKGSSLFAADPSIEQTPDPSRVGGIRDLVDGALDPDAGDRKRFVQYGVVDAAQGRQLQADTGLDLEGYRRNIDNFTVRHVLSEHGDPAREIARGNAPLSREDFEKLPQILDHPDASILAGKTARGRDVILSAKRVNGYFIIAEEVREGQRILSLATLYKKSAHPPGIDAATGATPISTPEASRSIALNILRQAAQQFNFLHGGGTTAPQPVTAPPPARPDDLAVGDKIQLPEQTDAPLGPRRVVAIRQPKPMAPMPKTASGIPIKNPAMAGMLKGPTKPVPPQPNTLTADDGGPNVTLTGPDGKTVSIARDIALKNRVQRVGGAGGTLGAATPAGADPSRLSQVKASVNQSLAKGKAEDRIASRFDAADTLAGISGRHAGNSVRLDFPDVRDRQAATAVVEAGGQRQELTADLAKVRASADPKLAQKYAPIYQHALDNLDRLQGSTGNYNAIEAREMSAARNAGLEVNERERYIAHAFSEFGRQDGGTTPQRGGIGAAPGAGAPKLADVINAGCDPGTMDLGDLTERGVARNQRTIQARAFQNGLAGMKASDGKPVLSAISENTSRLNADGSITSTLQVPKGYDAVQAGSNVLTVHKEFSPILQALYGDSAIRQSKLGNALLDAAAFAKHGTVGILDTYHGMRMLTKELTGFQTAGYGKGMAAQDYADADLDRAVKAGEVSQPEADYARQIRPTLDKLLAAGLNTGRVSDNLLEAAKQHDLISHLPVIGGPLSKLNGFIFHKLQRGAMTQAAVVAYNRNKARFPELSDESVARRAAKEVNEFFGNLGNQGFLKSKTMQDVARLVFLAPQWTESQARAEARGYAQAAKVPIDGIRGKGWRVGVVAQAMGGALLSALIANQALNLFTRGKPTWENPEDDHKWDAFIPGGTHGFFFSPLSIAAEYSHDLLKYMNGGETPLDAAAHIASNKLSGPARAVKDVVTGKDWRGQSFDSTGERLKAAATDALPLPMVAGPLIEKDPKSPVGYSLNHQSGAVEKQLLAMAGLKVDNAMSARSRMYQIAQPYRAQGGGQGAQSAPSAPSQYAPLRQALDDRDQAGVEDQIRSLLKTGKTMGQIGAVLGVHNEDGAIKPEVFTGSEARDLEMLSHLTPGQRSVYSQAQQDRITNGALFRQYALALFHNDPEVARLAATNLAHAHAAHEAHQVAIQRSSRRGAMAQAGG